MIVEAIMRRYALESARVADGGIREGAIRVAVHAGPAWRDRLQALAHGWETPARSDAASATST